MEPYEMVGRFPSMQDFDAQNQRYKANQLALMLQNNEVGNLPLHNQMLQMQLMQQQLANQKAQALYSLMTTPEDGSAPGQAPSQASPGGAVGPALAPGAPPTALPVSGNGLQPQQPAANGLQAPGTPMFMGHSAETWGRIHALGGPDMGATIKMLADGAVAPPGSEVKDLRTGAVHTVMTLPQGMVKNADGSTSFAPNFVDENARLEGAKAAATEGAKAKLTPLPPNILKKNPDGSISPVGGSVADYLSPSAPAAPGAPQMPMALQQLSPQGQQAALADMAARGQPLSSMTVNGSPAMGNDMQAQLDAAKKGGPAAIARFVQTVAPALKGDPKMMAGLAYDLHTPVGTPMHAMSAQGAPVAAPGGAPQLAGPADVDAATLKATQAVHADTDPVVALRKDLVTKSHEANQSFVNNLTDVVNNEGEIVGRNNRLQPLLDQLPKIGGFAQDQRTNFANNLKQAGLPDSVVNLVGSGDPTAAKTVDNQLSAAAIQTMLDTLNKEGKPNRVMYQALHEQQEGLAAGKPVLQNIMALQNQLYQQHLKQLGTATDLMAAPDYNPVKFSSQFAAAKSQQIAAPPAAALTGAPAAQAAPAPAFDAAAIAAELKRRGH